MSVHFEAYENNNTLEITVTDDGRGLPKKVEEKVKQGHKSFGLQILKERLLLISEEFAIENREGAKDCVSKLTIPLYHGIAKIRESRARHISQRTKVS